MRPHLLILFPFCCFAQTDSLLIKEIQVIEGDTFITAELENIDILSFKKEEDKQRELEYIKIKEWEEKFDREQKAREHRENLREQRLRQKELERENSFKEKENVGSDNFSSGLEKFEVDTTKEN